ncbi:MAG TPA: hypothetical protein VJQ51_04000 [Burkholderiales bacterium]|nr:hypothetical protein [Burkholderiales bacterium]
MLKAIAILLAASLFAFGQFSMAADSSKSHEDKGKSADAKKKGQSDSHKSATPATPATPADPGKSRATPATPATPPSK